MSTNKNKKLKEIEKAFSKAKAKVKSNSSKNPVVASYVR
jgi:hypothetical protein